MILSSENSKRSLHQQAATTQTSTTVRTASSFCIGDAWRCNSRSYSNRTPRSTSTSRSSATIVRRSGHWPASRCRRTRSNSLRRARPNRTAYPNSIAAITADAYRSPCTAITRVSSLVVETTHCLFDCLFGCLLFTFYFLTFLCPSLSYRPTLYTTCSSPPDDCGDESDEKYCLNTNTVYADRTLLAKKNRHNLHSYNQTMKWQNLKTDLPALGPNGCLVNEFRCNNGECIAAEKRCDLLVGGWRDLRSEIVIFPL